MIQASLERHPSLSSTSREETSWSQSVSKAVSDSVSQVERKRQEAIFELIQSETNFVKDMKLVQKVFVKPLMETPLQGSQEFLAQVFLNYVSLAQRNEKLAVSLTSRRASTSGGIIEKIGDVILGFFNSKVFQALLNEYVTYAGGHVFAKNILSQMRKGGEKQSSELLKWIEVSFEYLDCVGSREKP